VTVTYNVAVPGKGVTIGYSTTSGGSYTPVAQLKSVDQPSMEMGTWESTGLSSLAKEFLATILDGGEVSIHAIWNPNATTHAALFTHFTAGDILYWSISFPSLVGPGATGAGVALTFVGILTGFENTPSEVESYHEAAWKIKVSGLPAIA
jgi:hypothetical protein